MYSVKATALNFGMSDDLFYSTLSRATVVTTYGCAYAVFTFKGKDCKFLTNVSLTPEGG